MKKIDKLFYILLAVVISMMFISFANISEFPFTMYNLIFVLTWVVMGILLGMVIFIPKEKIKEITE